jgi:hypothetical protein
MHPALAPRRSWLVLPPGTIVPPPPAHHAAIGSPYGFYGRY